MTYEALLQDPATNLDTFDISGHTISLHEFRVAEYPALRSVMGALREIFGRTDNTRLRLAYMLTDALKESCILIACGTDLEPEAIVTLTPNDFMTALSKVCEKNINFFLDAALEQIENAAAN